MRHLLSATFVAAMLFSVAPLAGCLKDDIGVRCDDPRADSESTSTTINLQALDCESRICLSFGDGMKGARCTVPCTSDSDCPGGTVAGCPTFVCRVALRVGGAKCCRFCVCQPDGDSGTDEDAQICASQGIEAQCPSF